MVAVLFSTLNFPPDLQKSASIRPQVWKNEWTKHTYYYTQPHVVVIRDCKYEKLTRVPTSRTALPVSVFM